MGRADVFSQAGGLVKTLSASAIFSLLVLS